MVTFTDGGTRAKSEVEHYSCCAVHNMPAFPNGPCDCGGYYLDEDGELIPANYVEPKDDGAKP